MSKIKRLTKELQRQYRPTQDISSLDSLQDNFVYSILAKSVYGQEINGFSVVELQQWLQNKGITNDYQLYNMLFGGNYE